VYANLTDIRRYLMCARHFKQVAEFHRDMVRVVEAEHPERLPLNGYLVEHAERDARDFRLLAQAQLRELEDEHGRYGLAGKGGEGAFPLQGRTFETWPEHAEVFTRRTLPDTWGRNK
jgi:hypothetical protein